MVPTEELALVRAATQRLIADVRLLGDDEMRAPSALPGWTVAHVVTHLARNADSTTRRLLGAQRGEVVPQYDGGLAGRDADIEAGATRSAGDLIDDLYTSAAALTHAFDAIDDDAWERPIDRVRRPQAPAWTLAGTRLLEVEVHHADLDTGYEPRSWLGGFVTRGLRMTIERIGGGAASVAGEPTVWHLDRVDGEGEWTIRRTPDGSTVREGRPDSADDAGAGPVVVVRGPGWALLAWLLGRRPRKGAGLDIVGDEELAAVVPELFPYG